MYRGSTHYTLTKVQNGMWYYYVYDENGRRYKRSTGYTNKRLAVDEINRRISLGQLLIKPRFEKIRNITFSEFAEPFWIWDECPIIQDKLARGGHYSVDLCLANRKSMEKHILPYFGKYLLSEISRKMVDQWVLKLPKRAGISASTANKMLSILKQMLRVAVYDGYITMSPADSVKPLIVHEKARGVFLKEEIASIFGKKWKSRLAYTACFLAAFTGMRLGEIRALRPCCIHEGYIIVEASWSDKTGLKCTKSGKARIVPIVKKLQTLLKIASNGKEENELIFSSDGKIPFEDRRITDPLKEIMTKTGIDFKERNLTFHSFRHFFNTQIIAAGVSGEIVRNVIGHESEEMTDRYLHLGNEELASVKDVQVSLIELIQ